MSGIAKTASESLVIKNELLLPNDTNQLNKLMGARLMHWMDIAAGISSQKHSGTTTVTASVDNISFRHPIDIGCVVHLSAKVTRAFRTSMEVYITVMAEDILNKKKFLSNTAFFTFVALDKKGNPVQVPEVIPETQEEIELYNGALRRRELRLVMAGRMELKDTTELKNFLEDGNFK